ncbi:uncharacterized protein LOC132244104 [Alligator mississippiensis]|uniref:uncharacterized protein LOC132244104 n=1 Tax=Alligator mississippiensis TaxID=8496 RepID=UPI0028779336|nr:uncharacterized protein LOC132244104 [Alligator mississippiensis]
MATNLVIERCNTLNPATLLSLPSDGEPDSHDCLQVTAFSDKPGADLSDLPLDNPDLIFFVDGSSKLVNGVRRTGYAVVTPFKVLEAEPLPGQLSSQVAELTALTRACQLASGHSVNIWTDSKYAFGICHATGQLWKQRGFMTASGTKISNAKQVNDLLQAIMLPKAIAVMHCPAHTKMGDQVSKGNALADAAAQTTALQPLSALAFQTQIPQSKAYLGILLEPKMYKSAPPLEQQRWKVAGATCEKDGIWQLSDERIALPKAALRPYLQQLHQNEHLGCEKLATITNRLFYAPGVYQEAKRLLERCSICKSLISKEKNQDPLEPAPGLILPLKDYK